jgi:hypothetical protein
MAVLVTPRSEDAMGQPTMEKPKRIKKTLAEVPDPVESGQEGTETIRVSRQVWRMCRWLKKLEKGKPSSQELIDWAALENLRLRFMEYEDEVKKLEAEEREVEARMEEVRAELRRKGKPG